MNDQQVLGLIAACALVMIPTGIALALFWRQLHAWVSKRRAPRQLKQVGRRVRKPGRADEHVAS